MGNKKLCNLSCNIAAKLVEWWCCAFTTHIKPVLEQLRLLTGLNVGSKTRNFTIELVLQQCCNTSCTFFCCPFFGTFNRGLTMVSCKTTAEEVLFAWSRKWDAIIVDSVSVVLVFTLSLNECIVTALFRFQVHLPGIKWMESHKGVFNVAVRAVSSVHNQVRRMFFNLLIPANVGCGVTKKADLQWRTKILGTVMKNLPSTSLTYQMFRCSIIYTSLTTWIPRLALPSPLQTMLGWRNTFRTG